MKKSHIFIVIGIILLLISLAIVKKQKSSEPRPAMPSQLSAKSTLVKQIKLLLADGGRVDWSPKGDLIAFDRTGDDGYTDLWLMKPDGSDERCLTCSIPGIPQKNNGQPAWHPSGKYLIFQAENPNLKGFAIVLGEKEKQLTGPGAGINNDLWLMDLEKNKFWQLTNIKNKMGVLHPHFSSNGEKLVWAERITGQPGPVGQWAIRIADFYWEGEVPRLIVGQTLKPADMRFYETHGFSLDGQKIIFSATPDGYFQNLDIYFYDLATKELWTLTDTKAGQWDEHAQISHQGDKIVWMSSQDIPQAIRQHNVKADYWLMKPDGSEKQRLTYFNDPEAPEYLGLDIAAADSAWAPDGKSFLGYLIKRPTLEGYIVLIELNE